MAQTAFPEDWIKKFTDPYAVLGVSVAADDRRILKRYRHVAKQLHPDGQVGSDEAVRLFTEQVFTRLVNPAYQQLKQEKTRSEAVATLRFRVRRLHKRDQFNPSSAEAQQLLAANDPEVEVMYEQSLTQVATTQYDSPEQFQHTTNVLNELNLVYLRRKMGDLVIREKRTGLVAAPDAKQQVSIAKVETAESPPTPVNYADRHAQRAQEYMKKANYALAVQELRDAIKIEPNSSDYHCLIGQAYLMQKMTGMAKVHFRQALRLNSRNATARKYAPQVGLDLRELDPPAGSKSSQNKGLFGIFARKR